MTNAWITDQLEKLGKTQAALATHMGISANKISLMISGKRDVQIHEVVPMSAFLEIPIDEIVLNLSVSRLPAGVVPASGRAILRNHLPGTVPPMIARPLAQLMEFLGEGIESYPIALELSHRISARIAEAIAAAPPTNKDLAPPKPRPPE